MFSIAGHPLHPMLVALPVGLFAWVLVADIVYVLRDRDAVWYDIAFWTSLAAIVSALVAAVPGFGDYISLAIDSDARGKATLHMVLNLAVVVLFLIAALMMWDEGATSGGALTTVIVLHAVGVGLLAISGWLGGEMVFKHHLAVLPKEAKDARSGVMPAQAEQAHHETPPGPPQA